MSWGGREHGNMARLVGGASIGVHTIAARGQVKVVAELKRNNIITLAIKRVFW